MSNSLTTRELNPPAEWASASGGDDSRDGLADSCRSRLVQLQWWQQGKFAGQAQHQRELIEEVAARPGDIIDRQGRLLATTLTTRSLYLVPSRISNPAECADVLSEALQISRKGLLEKLEGNSQRQFVWIKRRLTEPEVERVKRCNLPKGSWGFRDEYRREYPQGIVAAHVLGLRDIDRIGRGGIEESFDTELRGRNGFRNIARDSRGHVIEIVDDELRPAVAGRTIRLSLDVVVQLFAERELDNVMREWGSPKAVAPTCYRSNQWRRDRNGDSSDFRSESTGRSALPEIVEESRHRRYLRTRVDVQADDRQLRP